MMFLRHLRSHILVHQRRTPLAFLDRSFLKTLLRYPNLEHPHLSLPLLSTRLLTIQCTPRLILHSPAFHHRAMGHTHKLAPLPIYLRKSHVATHFDSTPIFVQAPLPGVRLHPELAKELESGKLWTNRHWTSEVVYMTIIDLDTVYYNILTILYLTST